jgi:hypothetical protein
VYVNRPRSHARTNCAVITKPEIVKKMSTPKNPCGTSDAPGAKWNNTTPTTATTRNNSMSKRRGVGTAGL